MSATVECSPMEHTAITRHFLFRTSSVASKAPRRHKLVGQQHQCQQWVGVINYPHLQQAEMGSNHRLRLEEKVDLLLWVARLQQFNQTLWNLSLWDEQLLFIAS
jgi:hypothetical protein